MATNDPVSGWDQRTLIANEVTFGTSPDPVAAQGFEAINLDMGMSEAADRRPKKDKTLGRDMTLAFVSGRVPAIGFNIETSVKTRAAADTTPKESALYQSAGFTETTNSSTSVAYSMSSTPTIKGLSVLTTLGTGTATKAGEWGRGGLINQLSFSGGDTELMLKAAGAFIGKYTLGSSLVGTLTDGSDTTLALTTTTDAYRFGLGYYLIESEIVRVTAVNTTTGILTVTRAQLSTSAVAHSGVPVYPYMPTPTLAGSPISEALCTVTLDGTATRCTKFGINIETGIKHLPGETGSAYIQGGAAVRLGVSVDLEMVLTEGLMNLYGKANEFKSVALSIVCGTAVGGIATFSMPTCEIVALPLPAPPNDISIVSPKLRVRGSSGNDSLSFTFT